VGGGGYFRTKIQINEITRSPKYRKTRKTKEFEGTSAQDLKVEMQVSVGAKAAQTRKCMGD
jgi:hypothetical protein